MEQLETRDDAGAGRTQHAIHILAHDDDLAASLILPGLGRIDAAEESLQALIVAPDRDTAYAITAAINRHLGGATTLLTPIIASPRGERRLKASPRAICGTADDLVALMGKSLFKPQQLRSIAIVWADEQLAESAHGALETLLAEAPREADRLLIVSELTEAVERFATGFLWRARRVQHAPVTTTAAASLEYLPCATEARTNAVRHLLDRFDPASAALLAFSDDGQRDADAIIAALGYASTDGVAVAAARDRVEGAPDLVILTELPEDLRQLAGSTGDAGRAIALVPPPRVVAFAAALGEGAVPLAASQALREAYTARDVLRDEVLGTLRGRALTGEVLALEPVLADRDPVLVAAALLRLLEVERSKVRRAAPAHATRSDTGAIAPRRAVEAPAKPHDGEWTRLFLSAGERDGLRRGDLLGAITGEAGITGSQVGKIEMRDTHSLVEVASAVAEGVVAKMNGITLRGRRLLVKVDAGPGERRGGGDRAGRGRESGGRGRESAGRGRESSDRPRGGSFEGGGRFAGRERAGGKREFPRKRDGGFEGGARQPRAMRESEEWGSRGDRLRNARRRRPDDA